MSRPLISLVPEDQLGLLIDAFLDDLMLGSRSPKTITFYRSNLERFRWWCEEAGVPLDVRLIQPDHIRSFLRYLQSDVRWDGAHSMAVKPMKPVSIDAYYRSLRAFFNWCIKQEDIDRSPLVKVQRPRVGEEQPDPFSPDEVGRLFAAIEERGGRYVHRDTAILAALLDVGLRISELCGLHLYDYEHRSGQVTVREGKGGKSRVVFLGSRARRHVRQYWMQDRQHQPVVEDVPWLFLARQDKQLTRNAVRLMLDKLGRMAEIERVNPHRFRHTAAVNAIRAGMDTLHLQMMLGHSSLEMTRRYVKLAQADMEQAARQHSPLDHVSRQG